MGYQIIPQGKDIYSLFSSYSDSIVENDLTREQCYVMLMELAMNESKHQLDIIFNKIDKGIDPYFQFTMSLADAIKSHNEHNPNDIITELKTENTLTEDNLNYLTLWESLNGNLFLKVSDRGSIPLGKLDDTSDNIVDSSNCTVKVVGQLVKLDLNKNNGNI